jgi:putative membrane-bound dehydrogenase-like protein
LDEHASCTLSKLGVPMQKARLAILFLLAGTSAAWAQDRLRRNSGQPYLSPEETARRFTVPDGFEVRVFAAEPDVVNPIAMCFDERGRLWVVESFEYPKGAPPDRRPRDRIKIYEDRDGDGRADRVKQFADGLNLATGIAVGHGGVFVGAAPDLLFLRDSDGDDQADSREVLLTGFGRQDTHELLNTFTWGPDGWLYGCHGVFTHSKVRRPDFAAGGSDDPPIEMNAAVWRYQPRTHRFEIFAEGTSNPWGIDFDSHGNMFLTCCVIPHLFHMIPGGRYIRQAGQNRNPYDFGQLKEISDHLHHEESGWAHAGCVVLEGDLWPESLRGSVIFGSIHGNSIKRDVLKPNGSTFTASHAPDFLQSGDRNFRPVNQMIGPDGSIYVIDWCDQWPCHQTPPDLWDKERGRIFKIQPAASQATPPRDMRKLTDDQLVGELHSSIPYVHRTALRLLGERQAKSAAVRLRAMLDSGVPELEMRALWALDAVAAVDAELASKLIVHRNESVRRWMIRLAGESPSRFVATSTLSGVRADRSSSGSSLDQSLEQGARIDPSAAVRLQIAATCQRLPPDVAWRVLASSSMNSMDLDDPAIPQMIWFALEPMVAKHRDRTLAWLQTVASDHALVWRELVPRVTRRLASTTDADDLKACVAFASTDVSPKVQQAALQGIVAGLEGRRVEAPQGWAEARARLALNNEPSVQMTLQRLGATFRDSRVIREAELAALDESKPRAERVEAVRSIAVAQFPESLDTLERLLGDDGSAELRREVLRALAGYDRSDIPRLVIEHWRSLDDPLRTEAQTLLTGRRDWAHALLNAIAQRQLDQSAISAASAQRITALKDSSLTAKLEKTWGSVRQQTPGEINELIRRMRQVVAAQDGSAAAGRDVFKKKCAGCHKFNGQGAEVGPDITGADRSVEYLLINILDPNRVVGQPYYTHVVATKGGRVISGKLVSETPTGITIQGENDKVDIVPREDIDEHVVKHVSVMPEGLPKDMTDEQFRDLIEFLRRK